MKILLHEVYNITILQMNSENDLMAKSASNSIVDIYDQPSKKYYLTKSTT